jgi:hypothetical protein
MSEARETFLAVSQLKERGWTNALISRFLGDPDELRTNPHYRSGPQMRLYRTERVEQAEASAEFRNAQDCRKAKREAAQMALATKKKKLNEYVEAVEIEVPRLPKAELIRRACENYNAGLVDDTRDRPRAYPNSDPEFLERVCVNYLRHVLTQYEEHLEEIAGKVGMRDAYQKLKSKVLDAIWDEYDWLRFECWRQEDRMWEKEMMWP